MTDGEWQVGWGCATALYPTHVGPTAVRVRLLPDGSVTVGTAAHEIGNGAYTVIGQMAAERLGVPTSAVTVELGDSRLPTAIVAGGSSTTASTCSAVLKACDAIRSRLFLAATSNYGPLAGRDPSQLTLRDGHVVAPDGAAQKIEDTLKRSGTGAIEEYAEFIPNGAKPDAIKQLYAGKATLVGGSEGDKMMYAMGAEFVEVRVHAATREIRVPRIVGAFAAGRLMNTRTVTANIWAA